MIALAWPDDLPLPLRDGAEETLPQMADRSAVDAGPETQRRLSSADVRTHRYSYVMTALQWEMLRRFYAGPAAGGAVWFQFPNRFTDGETWLARFDSREPPRRTAPALYFPDFLVTVSLEVRAR